MRWSGVRLTPHRCYLDRDRCTKGPLVSTAIEEMEAGPSGETPKTLCQNKPRGALQVTGSDVVTRRETRESYFDTKVEKT